MFRGGKQQPKLRQATKEFDLDELLNSTLNHVGDEDLDMNDPELLKQLQGLSSTSTAQKPKPKQQQPPKKQKSQDMEIDFDSYAALAQGDDDIHVDLDENDFSDPHLLSELSSLAKGKPAPTEPTKSPSAQASELMNMGFTQRNAEKALAMFDNDMERAANCLFDSPNIPDDEDEDIVDSTPLRPDTTQHHDEQEVEQQEQDEEEEEESIDPQVWKQKAQEYQKMALAAKKSGDKKKAIELFRESKVYNQKCQDLLELHQPMAMDIQPQEEETHNEPEKQSPAPPARDITPPAPQRKLTPPQKDLPAPPSTLPPPAQPAAAAASPVPQQTAQDLQQAQELLGKVIALQRQYKEAALHYKGIGNLAAAKQMVRTSKDLLHTGISLKNGEIADLKLVKLPDTPDMNLGDGKIRQVEEVSGGAGINSYEQIEAQLTYQMNICHNLSIQSGNSSNKKSKMLSEQGDHYARTESAFSADLVSLSAYKSNNQNIPSLHYEQVNYTYKNILDNIPDNMMEFKIVRAISLPTLDISTNLEPFVTWDFGGWPPENTAQAAMNKGETPVVTGINPQYDFSMHIPISRTNRLFTRYVQRKKLTIEVFHNKYTYGLFRRPVSLGKVVLPMDRLLTKSSISGVYDLLDASRKKTGGKIEIQVNLREPLTGEDIVKRSERWLVLDSFGIAVSQCLSSAGLTVGGPYIKPSTPQVESSSIANSPAINQPEVVQQTPKPVEQTSKSIEEPPAKRVEVAPPVSQPDASKASEASVPAEGGELEQAQEEFNSVDNIVSNMVMEHEMGLVNAGMASKQPAKAKEDLMDRKQALEIKMNMLVIQVQTGMLDMDTYLENVQKRMDADRRLAIIFKKHNRLDLAKAALVRKKIMQDELDEARAAMAEHEE